MTVNQTLSFFDPVQNELNEVELTLRLQGNIDNPDLKAATDLIFKSGGKRIRPVLALLVGKMLGAEHTPLIAIASAIELLHTATLVHDDLIDGSLLRRGMPTLNSKWSPGATVLTGDYLFARAALKAAETNSIPIMHLFSNTLSVIVNGEIRQLFTGRCKVNREEYFQRIYAKTASLFETSAKSAALLSLINQEDIDALGLFGKNIGIAFQIMDDILDFTGEPSRLGKPIGSDLQQGIVTLPVILYSEVYPSDPEIQHLQSGNCANAERVSRLVSAILKSEAISLAITEAEDHVKKGISILSKFPVSLERQALIELAQFIVNRRL